MAVYAFQFQDGSFRLGVLTNTPYPRDPVARRLFDGIYGTSREARRAEYIINRIGDTSSAAVTRALALLEGERMIKEIESSDTSTLFARAS